MSLNPEDYPDKTIDEIDLEEKGMRKREELESDTEDLQLASACVSAIAAYSSMLDDGHITARRYIEELDTIVEYAEEKGVGDVL